MSFDDRKVINNISNKIHLRAFAEQQESMVKFNHFLKDVLDGGEKRDMLRMCRFVEAVLREQVWLADSFAILDYSSYADCLPELPKLRECGKFITKVAFGCCEGVYLDILYETRSTDTQAIISTINVGTMKTLREDPEALALLGKLAGVIPTVYYNYIVINWEA